MAAAVDTDAPRQRERLLVVRDAVVIGAVVCAAALFGILTRPTGNLAVLWPANALLVGLLVRTPRRATLLGWLAASAGHIIANRLTGGSWVITLWLTAANIGMATTAFYLFQLLSPDDRRLRTTLSVLYLFAVAAAGALAAAIVGARVAPIAFQRDPLTGMEFWFVAELVNASIILPVVLTTPTWPQIAAWRAQGLHLRLTPTKIAPAVGLVIAGIASVAIGGPGAIAFSGPALLWCALSYSVFTTAVLTLCFSAWQMLAISYGFITLPMGTDFITATMSLRLAIALLALGPLTVATVNAARDDVLNSLHHAANYDALTDALTRTAFTQRATARLADAYDRDVLVVLMLDIDHFKSINDRYGHAVGDRVLVTFANTLGGALRDGDLFGRLGGEEFAAMLNRPTLGDAIADAERLQHVVEHMHVALRDGSAVTTTVSIGLAYRTDAATTLDTLLSAADQALYRAKVTGRNRVEVGQPHKSATGIQPLAGLTRSRRTPI